MLKRIIKRLKNPEFIERTVDVVFFVIKIALVITIPLFLWQFTKALTEMREATEDQIRQEETLKRHVSDLQIDSIRTKLRLDSIESTQVK